MKKRRHRKSYVPAKMFIDRGPLDIKCVAATDHSSILGKPRLNILIDVYSHSILGYFLDTASDDIEPAISNPSDERST